MINNQNVMAAVSAYNAEQTLERIAQHIDLAACMGEAFCPLSLQFQTQSSALAQTLEDLP